MNHNSKKILKGYEKLDKSQKTLIRKFNDFARLDNNFGKVCSEIENIALNEKIPMYYFGGFLTDIYMGLKPRDVDIVFYQLFKKRFKEIFSKNKIKENRFGGLKLNLYGIEVDAWPIEETLAFRDYFPNSVNQLSNITFFNSEAIIMEAFQIGKEKRAIFQNGFFNACKNKILEIVNPDNPFPELQIGRTIHKRDKLRWKIGENLRNYIKWHYDNSKLEEITQIYNQNYKTEVSKEFIKNKIEKIINKTEQISD